MFFMVFFYECSLLAAGVRSSSNARGNDAASDAELLLLIWTDWYQPHSLLIWELALMLTQHLLLLHGIKSTWRQILLWSSHRKHWVLLVSRSVWMFLVKQAAHLQLLRRITSCYCFLLLQHHRWWRLWLLLTTSLKQLKIKTAAALFLCFWLTSCSRSCHLTTWWLPW